MTQPHIRMATAADGPAARAVVTAAYAPHLAALPDLPDVTDGIEEEIATLPSWVAEGEGAVMGVIITRPTNNAFYIANLAVDPRAAGQGIASQLLATAEAFARNQGFTELRLATHRDMGQNVAFYERRGWRVTETKGNRVTMARTL